MEDEIKNAFDKLTMSDKCASAIEAEMQEKYTEVLNSSSSLWRRFSAAAAAIVLIMLIVVGNAEIVEAITANFTRPTKPGCYSSQYYDVDIDNGRDSIKVKKNLFLLVNEGRLYFTANGENIDITDKFSKEVPYEYTFIDDNGFLNYIAIGGVFDADHETLDGMGFDYHILYPDLNGDGIYNDGGSGSGQNHVDRETNDYFGWYEIAQKRFREITRSQRDTE